MKKWSSALCLVSTVTLATVATATTVLQADLSHIVDVRVTSGAGSDVQLLINDSSAGMFWAKSVPDGPNCPAPSLDVRKSWLSMAQSALLSGKKLHASYIVCASGVQGIYELWLVK